MALANLSIARITTLFSPKQTQRLVDLLQQPRPSAHTAAARQGGQPALEPMSPQKKGDVAGPINEETDIVKVEQTLDRHFKIASVSLAVTTVGALFYSPLLVLGMPGIVYTAVTLVFPDAYHTLVKKGQVGVGLVDSIAIVGMLATGNFFIATAATWLIMLSLKILHKTEDHSLKQLVNILGDQSRSVWVYKEGVEVEIPLANLQVKDVIIVNTGETVPVDGAIVHGVVSVDQHILTGEAQPVEKGVRDTVFASTVVLSGRMQVVVERAGAATVAAQIGKILHNTADYRSSVQARGQAIADKAAWPTLLLGAVTWPLLGLNSAVAALQSAFGYNMRLISPISVLNFLKIMSEQGILIKDGRSLEALRQVDTVVFDKTGTLTLEQPQVKAIHLCHGHTEQALLTYAYAAEYRQTHPIAKAIQEEARNRQLVLHAIDHAHYETGYGIKVTLGETVIQVGSERFMSLAGIAIPPEITAREKVSHAQGHSFVYVAVNQELGGAIELQPTLRPEAKATVQFLQKLGLTTYIISGDRAEPTRRLAHDLGIDHYFAEVLPEQKSDLVGKLQQAGHFVCFVGDGINDSIALKKANVAISLRGAATVATDTAHIILLNGRLNLLESLFTIAVAFERNMQVNLMTTIIPGIVCIGGVFFWHFGIMQATLLYCVGLAAGITNAMAPTLKRK